MFAFMFSGEHLTESQSPILASRLLQPFGLALLSICAAMSLVLYRISMQMGGGRLAVALAVADGICAAASVARVDQIIEA